MPEILAKSRSAYSVEDIRKLVADFSGGNSWIRDGSIEREWQALLRLLKKPSLTAEEIASLAEYIAPDQPDEAVKARLRQL